MRYLIMAALAVVVLARPGVGAWRFAQAGPGRRYWLPMQWARLRWKWLARNTQLAPLDSNADPKTGTLKSRIRYPKARFRLDEHGWQVRVRTVPLVGRAECEQAATHLANHWRASRVGVTQTAPGRITLRALRSDPLGRNFGQDRAPDGTYGLPVDSRSNVERVRHLVRRQDRQRVAENHYHGKDLRRLYLGVDEWGEHRYLPLGTTTGITVGGLPGFGKTGLVTSWLCQLAGTAAVQFALIDGKGSEDYACWGPRAWLSCGDDLAAAVEVLEQVYGLMRERLGKVQASTGHRNAWHAGPSEAWPLIVTVIDESHTFFDLAAYKGRPGDEAAARRAVWLTGQLIKKGRSPLFLTILATQKQTGDATPTALRDNCGLGLSFAARTKDAAVAALGEGIREYAGYCPTLLRESVGVCTATLTSGTDPYVRIRVPEVTEEAAEARAAETARFRRDPAKATHAPGLVAVA